MHKSLTMLSLAVLFTTGSTLAGQAEWETLNKSGFFLNREITTELLSAREEKDIAVVMGKLVRSLASSGSSDQTAVSIKGAVNVMVNLHPSMAVAITSAGSSALSDFPTLVAMIVEGAVEAVPAQAPSIARAAKFTLPGSGQAQAQAIDNAVSNALSSVIYKQNSLQNTPPSVPAVERTPSNPPSTPHAEQASSNPASAS